MNGITRRSICGRGIERPVAGGFERTVLIPRGVGPGGGGDEAGGDETAQKGTKQAHGKSLGPQAYGQRIEYPMNGPKSPVHLPG